MIIRFNLLILLVHTAFLPPAGGKPAISLNRAGLKRVGVFKQIQTHPDSHLAIFKTRTILFD